MLTHDPLEGHRLSLKHILDASHTVDPVFLNTPQYRAEALERELGFELVVKVETLNPIRSFKGRGADYLVASLEPGTQIVCASAGNWGQAMAYACRKRGLELICYAANGANTLKLERIRALGAEVRLYGEDFDAAKLEAKRYAQESVARMVEDGLDPLISEGAGTLGLELCSYPEPLDAVLIPLGNGAMLNGTARAIKSLSPKTQVIAVCAQGATSMLESWKANRVIEHERIHTIADGIGVRIPILEAVEDMQGLVDDGLTVSDTQMVEAMRKALETLGVLLEPSGAAGLAAAFQYRSRFAGKRVATILCGGNVTAEQFRAWFS
ncbi:MAG: pyridoxal-phosphate dependent enzyme [Pseudopedobacter sp.]|nr:pyridoxal-phosphate dependent enzyme [Deinococcales bacterium]